MARTQSCFSVHLHRFLVANERHITGGIEHRAGYGAVCLAIEDRGSTPCADELDTCDTDNHPFDSSVGLNVMQLCKQLM